MSTIFEVGKPFPGPVPANEGAIMELWRDGLTVLIQMPGCTEQERQAFVQRLSDYSYLETSTPVPIAVWIFNFEKPHGPIDMNFNARVVKSEYVMDYIDTTEGIKNRIIFYLLEEKILRGIKLVGLDPEAVELFHDTIKKQLSLNYTQAEYDKYLSSVYLAYSTEELFQMGRKFTK